jgi:hypothetical protein
MALKDWKKKKGDSWSKKTDEYTTYGSFWQTITIYPANREFEVEVVDFNDKIVNSPVILERSYYKDKTQALSYAKQYMMTH